MTYQEIVRDKDLLKTLHHKALKKNYQGDYAITLLNELIALGLEDDEALELCLYLIYYEYRSEEMRIETIINTPYAVDYILE